MSLSHKARAFPDLPDAAKAARLLADIATAPCPFKPVRMDRPLALYGAGNFGRLARDFLRTVGHDFTLAIDRNAARIAQEPSWAGAKVATLEDVPAAERRGMRIAVSVVLSPYVPIEQMLSDAGFDGIVPFFDIAESFRAVHPLSNGWFAAPMSSADISNVERALAGWHDDTSRAHHLQFLAWRRMREEWTFEQAPHQPEPRFFIPEVKAVLRDDETYADAGAYHGVVIGDFIAQTAGRFRGIVAIEPDPASHSQLVKMLPSDNRITVRDDVLAERDGPVIFHDGLGYASQISQTGALTLRARALDSLALRPTFMKLHLEGGELPALKGAARTLSANRPIVAVTVYHNDDGIYRTPLWLMENLTDYRLYFRTHAWCGNGAVIYGMPEERVKR